ncbi:MAG: hypothetical protein NVV73_01600 [Cellvibrionaceae bacterium]|nr:hypothetical protein [Cellvibrionaceae bacterium]
MNITRRYAETGRTANQFQTLLGLGMIKGNTIALPAFPALNNTRASIAERALSYIHVNCSSCHRGAGGSQSIWDARYGTPFADKGLCNTPPITPVTDVQPEYYVNPGEHQSSSIWWRIHLRGSEQMPPLGSNIVDAAGTALLAEWIDGLTDADCK